MTNPAKPSAPESASAMDRLMNAPIAFGLTAQGHMPTIDRMMALGIGWDEIGKEIGCDPATALDFWKRETEMTLRSKPC